MNLKTIGKERWRDGLASIGLTPRAIKKIGIKGYNISNLMNIT
jgi:hypothetical protein